MDLKLFMVYIIWSGSGVLGGSFTYQTADSHLISCKSKVPLIESKDFKKKVCVWTQEENKIAGFILHFLEHRNGNNDPAQATGCLRASLLYLDYVDGLF